MNSTLAVRHLSSAIAERNGTTRPLFTDLNLTLTAADRSVAILGRSGSGKSTLLRILAGLQTDYTGEYRYGDTLLPRGGDALARHRWDHIGIITQRYDLLDDLSVLRNVRMGDTRRDGATERARALIAAVGLSGAERTRARRLSGGEAQRVAIARAMVKSPALVLADEPTGALDAHTEDEVLTLFSRLQNSGSRFIVVTHSDRVAARCERRLLLENGALRELA